MDDNNNQNLFDHRKHAAALTKGVSEDAILNLVINLIKLKKDTQTKSLIDYGAGAGNLIAKCCDENLFSDYTGIDIQEKPARFDNRIKWVEQDLNQCLPDEHATPADFVVSTEVIEHLENPRMMLRELFRLVKPGGWIIVTTPNQESIRSYACLLFGGHFAEFRNEHYPAHITALLRLDFYHILKETGFINPQYFYTNSGLVPKIAINWQKYSLNLLKGRLFSDNIAFIAQKPTS